MNFGQILKNRRIEQMFTQEELAEKANVTTRAIIYWENGQRKMTLENADKVFKALGVAITIGAQHDEGRQHGDKIETKDDAGADGGTAG